ncbi:hypothetical protein M0P98_01200 [bacterium]|nr:hypothetical protein [bacterium]
MNDSKSKILTKDDIKAYAKKCGFVDCGITDVSDFNDYKETIDRMLSSFPETKHLYSSMEGKAYIKKNVPWAKSIIVCLRSYAKYKIPKTIKGYIGRNYLFDSRVLHSPEYQMSRNFTQYLKNSGIRVKKGGLPDRAAAKRAGVVSIGKNNFAFSKICGSWFNISTYIVDIELKPDNPSVGTICPEGCDICIRACPTKALSAPYTMRMDKCIAFLTYGKEAEISEELCKKMGTWLYGCDVCQEVCPLNKGKWQNIVTLPYLEKVADIITPSKLSEMGQKTYEEIVFPLFNYIPVDRIDRWHNNAKRVLKYIKNNR